MAAGGLPPRFDIKKVGSASATAASLALFPERLSAEVTGLPKVGGLRGARDNSVVPGDLGVYLPRPPGSPFY